ncbi:nuclear transport factor 2 family protein [Actinosynnema sp. NPDC050436]|uniref:nuclear transport factor 2 family protein n=1 Tax=Actinosynnema sp. NPDC050436 TaxID=3155659 RepID=UPI0034112006
MTASKSLRALREALVLEHLESENEHEFAAAVAAFDHPRCEVVATGEVFEGAPALAGYYARAHAACPDRRSRLLELHHADDAVIVELALDGTRAGVPFSTRMTAFFVFEGARLVGKRLYGDTHAPALTG